MKTVRPILQNIETGEIHYNCSLAFIAGMVDKVPMTIQRWAKGYRDKKFNKKLVGDWVIHFDAIEYKQNKI